MTAHTAKNIVLIGYRGSGKTSVGRLLADRLGWAFVDTDDLIESQAGTSIADIFATEGEAGFRAREREAIAKATQDARRVIAVGGGAVTDRRNVERLRLAAKVVWLTAQPDVLWQRINQDDRTRATRPNLTPGGGLEEVRRVLADRESAYRDASDFAIDTEQQDSRRVAGAVLATLGLG